MVFFGQAAFIICHKKGFGHRNTNERQAKWVDEQAGWIVEIEATEITQEPCMEINW
jgi:hypothetical protein